MVGGSRSRAMRRKYGPGKERVMMDEEEDYNMDGGVHDGDVDGENARKKGRREDSREDVEHWRTRALKAEGKVEELRMFVKEKEEEIARNRKWLGEGPGRKEDSAKPFKTGGLMEEGRQSSSVAKPKEARGEESSTKGSDLSSTEESSTMESESESDSEGSVCLFGVCKPKKLSKKGLEEELERRNEIKLNLVLKGDASVWKVFHLYNVMGPMLKEKVYIELEDKKRRIYKAKEERDKQLLLGNKEKWKELGIRWEKELTKRQWATKKWVEAEANYQVKRGSKVERVKGNGLMIDGKWYEWDEREGELLNTSGGDKK